MVAYDNVMLINNEANSPIEMDRRETVSGGGRVTDNHTVVLPDSVSVATVAGGRAMKRAQCSHTTRLILSL